MEDMAVQLSVEVSLQLALCHPGTFETGIHPKK